MTPTTPEPLKVLVVAECYEAGTGAVIESIATEMTDVEFHLLWSGDGKSLSLAGFASAHRMSTSVPGRIKQVRQLARAFGVDVVHAHSSWAGVYARVLSSDVPVVYQPHGFSFANRSLSAPGRMVGKAMEWLLAHRAQVIVAVSDAEARAARGLGLSADRVRLVPNSSMLTGPDRTRNSGFAGGVPTVVMIGRLVPEKDPPFFAELARRSAGRDLPFRFVWIGDGHSQVSSLLAAAGVEVTGWLSRDALSEHLGRAFVYVHTAVAEGFPISILDAAAFGIPILARPLPPLSEAGLPTYESPDEFLDELELLYAQDARYRERQHTSAQLKRRYSRAAQAADMRDVYAALARGHRPSPPRLTRGRSPRMERQEQR
jgi:glycosyltransferase involved in cell wall biosynthesis